MENSQRPRLFSALQEMSRTRPDMVQKILHSMATADNKQAQVFRPPQQSKVFSSSQESLIHGSGIAIESVPATPERHNIGDNFTRLNNPMPSLSMCLSSDKEPQPADESSCEMTIFYNGSVKKFNLPRSKAEKVMTFADANVSENHKAVAPVKVEENQPQKPADSLPVKSGGLAIVRKASLQRFLQKRKDRLISVAPYPVTKSESSPLKPKDCEIQDQDLDLSLSIAPQKC